VKGSLLCERVSFVCGQVSFVCERVCFVCEKISFVCGLLWPPYRYYWIGLFCV